MKENLRALFSDESPEFQRQGAEFMKSDRMLSLSRRIRQTILSIREKKLSREAAFNTLREAITEQPGIPAAKSQSKALTDTQDAD